MYDETEMQGIERRMHTAFPPQPSEEALARVRDKSEAIRPRSTSAFNAKLAWRLVGVAAATAVLVLGTLVAAPSWESRAFARDEAADALVFAKDGRVTHIVTRFTETSWNEQYGHDERYDLDQRGEEWYDPSGRRSYSRTVNVNDGSLDGVSVRVDDQEMTFGNNVRYMTGKAPQLLAGPTSLPFGSTVGSITDQVRAEIADGHAKIKGTQVVDGEECWVVVIDVNELVVKHKYGEKPDPKSSDIITVTLRKSDYLMTTWERESVMFNGNGKCTGSMRLEVELLEHIEPSKVDDSMFSIEAVRKLAPEGTKVTKMVDGAAVE